MSRHCIKLVDLKTMVKEQNVDLRPGDLLFVRSGWIKWYEEHSPDERRAKVRDGSTYVGVDGSEEVIEWVWNNHFAAIAGDAIGFEAWPPQLPWCTYNNLFDFSSLEQSSTNLFKCSWLTALIYTGIHDYVLALWGMPLGELFDLEALAAECEAQKRWSFFVTSAPLNTPGGIASPPNALAVF